MSTQQMPPYQPPPEPNISARTLVTVVAVVFVFIIGIALAVILLGGGGSTGSPSGTVKGYVAGFNDGDMRAAFDHTVLKFMPNYDELVSLFDNYSYSSVMHIKLSDISVTYNSSMTMDQMQEAQDMVNDIMMVVDVQIDNTAFVSYTMTVTSSMYAGGAITVPGEMLCVEIDGSWYIATLGMPDMFQ